MAAQFDGKVFVTSSTKAQAVKKLLDYWSMKTDLLKKRQDPTLFANKDVQQKTRDYLIQNTKLKETQFFKKFDEEDQEKATKCFTMQEVPQPKKEMIAKNRLKAIVYICLSGSATVKNMKNGNESNYGVGDVFGSMEHFNKVLVNGEEFKDGHPDDLGTPEDIIEFSSGTFVRMELNDIYNTLLKKSDQELEIIETIKEQTTAVQISGISWDKMTIEDKFYVRVYKRTKEMVNKRFFSFLDSYHMIPKNATMPAYKYYYEGNKGREIYLDRRDQSFVFIFVDGSVKVELVATNVNSTEHTVSYVRKSDQDHQMHIKKKTMPLLLLSAGSVLCVHPECFAVADDRNETDEDDFASIVSRSQQQMRTDEEMGTKQSKFRSRFPPSRSNSTNNNNTTSSSNNINMSKRDLHSQQQIRTTSGNNILKPSSSTLLLNRMNSENTIDSNHTNNTNNTSSFYTINTLLDKQLNHKSDHFIPLSQPSIDMINAQYHIKLVFQSTTSYLAVPYNNFSRILDDNKLVLPKIAKEIKWYLHSPSDQICDRIKRLMPWLQGNIDFTQQEKSNKQKKVLDFIPAEIAPRLVNEELSIPFGSFTSTSGFAPTSSTDLKLSIKTNTNRSSQDFSGNNTGSSGGFSYKNTSRRSSSEQDLTMNTMLQSLRMNRESQKTSQSNKSSNKIISLKNNTRASMFMTLQDNENDFAILEEPSAIENDDSDDSDVGIDDFRPKKRIQEENNMIKSSKFSDSMNSLNDGCYDTGNATATSTIRSSLPTICPNVDVHVPPPELRSSNSLIAKVMSDDFFDHDEPLKKVIGLSVVNSLEPSDKVHCNDTTSIIEDVDLQSI